MLPVAVARSFSDDNVICYVLAVLWMTSRFHIMAQILQIRVIGELFIVTRSPGSATSCALWAKSALADYFATCGVSGHLPC